MLEAGIKSRIFQKPVLWGLWMLIVMPPFISLVIFAPYPWNPLWQLYTYTYTHWKEGGFCSYPWFGALSCSVLPSFNILAHTLFPCYPYRRGWASLWQRIHAYLRIMCYFSIPVLLKFHWSVWLGFKAKIRRKKKRESVFSIEMACEGSLSLSSSRALPTNWPNAKPEHPIHCCLTEKETKMQTVRFLS